jgi:hypothetical protein
MRDPTVTGGEARRDWIISPNEIATLNALRAGGPYWRPLDEIWERARGWAPVNRRTVKHHLARFAEAQFVDFLPQIPLWRWNVGADPDRVAALSLAAKSEGLELVDVPLPPDRRTRR